jgi:hydroxyacylglutathione hydrolase
MRFDEPVPADLRTVGQVGFRVRTKAENRVILRYFPVGPIQCNCIVLADERSREAIVVDPGDDADAITRALRDLDVNVTAVIATHAHIDHVGALAALKQATRAPAMLHEADVPLYENLAVQAAWLGVATPPLTSIDQFLKEGDRLNFGPHSLRVIHTPGHSPGSLSFVVNTQPETILSGDTLFAGSIGRTDLWGGSYAEIMRSILNKLIVLGDDAVVVPGHGPQTTIGTERRTNPFIVERA